jgi:pimeloyl-ACP methyl ester carboxylesterase
MRIPLQTWQSGGSAMSHRGHSIFTRCEGPATAPVLLLIHGFPTASWDWEALWPELTRRWRVLALDMIGFGFSDKPRGYRYGIADQADLQEAFLQAHGVAEYHVLAHDYGDTVAQELLARQDEPGPRPHLASVAFLNGGLFPETHRPLVTQKLLLSPAGPLVAGLMRQGAFSRAMRRIFGADTQPDDELLDAFWQLIEFNQGRRAFPSLIRYMPERRQHRERWVGALVRTAIPRQLIAGATDPISGAHMAERYRQLVPQPDLTLLARIGHYPQCEAPRQVLSAYLSFRDKMPQRRPDAVPSRA